MRTTASQWLDQLYLRSGKRLFDVIVALTVLILASPIIVSTALLTRIMLGSPIIFRQKRAGYRGQQIEVLKFRTMTDERDAAGNLLPDEQRLKPFGVFMRRYSLDELPQLINVLRGDLSLVGPRPLLMDYLPLYSAEQARRHDVKPGITGLAQVNGRNAISWEAKFTWDVRYVDTRSFLLDMDILFRTALKVVRPSGISQAGHATAERFMGSQPQPTIVQPVTPLPAAQVTRPILLRQLAISDEQWQATPPEVQNAVRALVQRLEAGAHTAAVSLATDNDETLAAREVVLQSDEDETVAAKDDLRLLDSLDDDPTVPSHDAFPPVVTLAFVKRA